MTSKIDINGDIIEIVPVPNISTGKGDVIYPISINKIHDDFILYYSHEKIYSLNQNEFIDTLSTEYTLGIDNKKAYMEGG